MIFVRMAAVMCTERDTSIFKTLTSLREASRRKQLSSNALAPTRYPKLWSRAWNSDEVFAFVYEYWMSSENKNAKALCEICVWSRGQSSTVSAAYIGLPSG